MSSTMSSADCDNCACCVDETNEEANVSIGSSTSETAVVATDMQVCYTRCAACCHDFEHRNCRTTHDGCGGDSSAHVHQHHNQHPKYRHAKHGGVAPISSRQLDSLQPNSCVTMESANAAMTTDAHKTQLPKLSLVDRLLTPLILGAMAVGMIIGAVSSSAASNIDSWSDDTTNYPIAAGLIVMIYPPLARVRYDRIGRTIADKINAFRRSRPAAAESAVSSQSDHFSHMMLLSLLLNWIVGPLLMFFLAVACLPDKPHFIQGLILVGLARCIAMVMVWNNLAAGSEEYCVLLVLLNSAFQLFIYAPYAYFFISVFLPGIQLPSINGDSTANGIDQVSFLLILQSVGIYLGIPFAAGFFSWLLIPLFTGRVWYNRVWIPWTSPLTLIALLFTIIIMFALKGGAIASSIVDIIRICVPLCIYFAIMFIATFYVCFKVGFTYPDSVTLAFTAASNNFELAIAVAVASFGINADESLAAVVGPLVEVPVMLAFVHLARYSRKWYSSNRWHSSLDERNMEKESAMELPAITSLSDHQPTVNVVFICTGNSCRSQIAEALTNALFQPNIRAYSAGTHINNGVNEYAVRVMRDLYDIDISHHRPKTIDSLPFDSVKFDLAVTVCDSAASECPSLPSNSGQSIRIIHRSFDDPPARTRDLTDDEEKLEVFERVSKEIYNFVLTLPTLIGKDCKSIKPNKIPKNSIEID